MASEKDKKLNISSVKKPYTALKGIDRMLSGAYTAPSTYRFSGDKK